MAGALAGVKVIEAASYVTGPFASQLLADMGAEVVKIEEPSAVIRFAVGGKEITRQRSAA